MAVIIALASAGALVAYFATFQSRDYDVVYDLIQIGRQDRSRRSSVENRYNPNNATAAARICVERLWTSYPHPACYVDNSALERKNIHTPSTVTVCSPPTPNRDIPCPNGELSTKTRIYPRKTATYPRRWWISGAERSFQPVTDKRVRTVTLRKIS